MTARSGPATTYTQKRTSSTLRKSLHCISFPRSNCGGSPQRPTSTSTNSPCAFPVDPKDPANTAALATTTYAELSAHALVLLLPSAPANAAARKQALFLCSLLALRLRREFKKSVSPMRLLTAALAPRPASSKQVARWMSSSKDNANDLHVVDTRLPVRQSGF